MRVYWPYAREAHSSARSILAAYKDGKTKFDPIRIQPGIRRDANNKIEADIIEGIVKAYYDYYDRRGLTDPKTGLTEITINGKNHKVEYVPARRYSAYKIEGFPNLIFKMPTEQLELKPDPDHFMNEASIMETIGHDLIGGVEDRTVDGIKLKKIPGFAACAYVRHPYIDGGVCIQQLADIEAITGREIDSLFDFIESHGIEDYDKKYFNLGITYNDKGEREAVIVDNEGARLTQEQQLQNLDRHIFWVDGSGIESKHPPTTDQS